MFISLSLWIEAEPFPYASKSAGCNAAISVLLLVDNVTTAGYIHLQVSSVLGLSRGLGEDFALIHKGIVPCVRPLADRIFEYSSAEATIWRRD